MGELINALLKLGTWTLVVIDEEIHSQPVS